MNIGLNISPIAVLLIGLTAFSVILVITMLEAGKAARQGALKTGNISGQSGLRKDMDPPYGSYDSEMTALLTGLDTENRLIMLFDTQNGIPCTLSYTGATDVRDKFGQVITIPQLPVGQLVDAGYNKGDGRLLMLRVSPKAWEYAGVGNLSIDDLKQEMRISKKRYKYTDDILIVDNGKPIRIWDLAEQDELTVRGLGETIWSITVARGHGTVRLKDVEAFMGGNVTVGYEAMQQITEDTVITVREGNFNLTAENGEYSGTKNIIVRRNEETVVSLGDLGPEPVKHGLVNFTITPFGADLYLDGELTFYGEPVELSYGEHRVEASLGGYTAYKGILTVNSAGKKIKIDLPEETRSEKATFEETDGAVAGEETAGDGTKALPEYNTWVYPIVGSEADEETENDFIIDKAHSIYVQNPEGASVYLNGDFIGISPGRVNKIIGYFVLTFIREGYETMSYTIEVADDGLDTYISLPDLMPLKN